MNEDPPLPTETPKLWLHYADEDLRVATNALKGEDPACHTICFLCQSAAEKFLKSYLIARGWELKKTHDIVELLEYCSGYDPKFDDLSPFHRITE